MNIDTARFEIHLVFSKAVTSRLLSRVFDLSFALNSQPTKQQAMGDAYGDDEAV